MAAAAFAVAVNFIGKKEQKLLVNQENFVKNNVSFLKN
jgi:hypothetical protein